jgi:hypothetical protein
MKKQHERHITSEQREDISVGLEDSMTAPPVTMTANASNKEAVCYQGEIASVLEDIGCTVKIDNATRKAPEQEIPAGVEMTVKETTVRPINASRILRAFRRAGVVIATRINARRRKNNTLYITVGSPSPVPPSIQTGAAWRWWKSLAALLAKWKIKFA